MSVTGDAAFAMLEPRAYKLDPSRWNWPHSAREPSSALSHPFEPVYGGHSMEPAANAMGRFDRLLVLIDRNNRVVVRCGEIAITGRFLQQYSRGSVDHVYRWNWHRNRLCDSVESAEFPIFYSQPLFERQIAEPSMGAPCGSNILRATVIYRWDCTDPGSRRLSSRNPVVCCKMNRARPGLLVSALDSFCCFRFCPCCHGFSNNYFSASRCLRMRTWRPSSVNSTVSIS